MNDGLLDAVRHNAWATRKMLARCRDLTPNPLGSTVAGVYGDPVTTLWHIVRSEASYYSRLSDQEPDWDWRAKMPPNLDELAARAADMAARWEAFLAVPFDAKRTLVYNAEDGARVDIPSGVVLAQAIHHGSDHRSQINTIFTAIGVEPLEYGVWDYAEDTNRAKPHRG
jgi:uncharacterized damage-inducible protein DinB